MRIWKFPLLVTDWQIVEMPRGAKILTAQLQKGFLQLWALCDETAPKERRRISIYGTGNEVDEKPGRYISTFQVADGDLVFHVFEDTAGL